MYITCNAPSQFGLCVTSTMHNHTILPLQVMHEAGVRGRETIFSLVESALLCPACLKHGLYLKQHNPFWTGEHDYPFLIIICQCIIDWEALRRGNESGDILNHSDHSQEMCISPFCFDFLGRIPTCGWHSTVIGFLEWKAELAVSWLGETWCSWWQFWNLQQRKNGNLQNKLLI